MTRKYGSKYYQINKDIKNETNVEKNAEPIKETKKKVTKKRTKKNIDLTTNEAPSFYSPSSFKIMTKDELFEKFNVKTFDELDAATKKWEREQAAENKKRSDEMIAKMVVSIKELDRLEKEQMAHQKQLEETEKEYSSLLKQLAEAEEKTEE